MPTVLDKFMERQWEIHIAKMEQQAKGKQKAHIIWLTNQEKYELY